jgi:hypothetical protein
MKWQTRAARDLLACSLIWVIAALPGKASEKKAGREAGEFKIFVAGREIGTEQFEITILGDKAISNSRVLLRHAVAGRQTVRLETHLEMNTSFVPTAYQLKSDVDGKTGTITGSFAPNQAIFEYPGVGAPRKEGLLTGSQYTLLDTNVFHHFCFIARLFRYDSSEKLQRFEVAIPQETDSGAIKVSQVGKEPLAVRGKKTTTYHLHLDSGSLQIEMWVNDKKEVQKLAVPARGIEIERAS